MASTALTQITPTPASSNPTTYHVNPLSKTSRPSCLLRLPAHTILLDHSGRLKYASAQDLPSYPSSGLKKDDAAAGAAASLGWANSISHKRLRSDISASSSASASASASAALSANDGMASPRQNRRNTVGSQAAIIAAAGSAQRQQQQQRQQQSSPPSGWGGSAANFAFKASMAPAPAAETPSLARQGSVRAAQGAMAGPRPRAKSSPMTKDSYPDQHNAASNALSAATIAHQPSMRAPVVTAEEGGAVSYTTMDRQMFTFRPPVRLEVEEKNRNDVLHASAVAMAKQMYTQQQKIISTTKAHVRSSSFTRHDNGSITSGNHDEQPVRFNNLHEAAYHLAQQRLTKLHEEHQQNRDLQDYYGSPGQPQRNTLGTIRNRLTRRRSASDGALIEDQKRSQQIRKQMSMFDTKVTEVDEQKRTRDREALLAAAQRNVKERLRGMDERLQSETGRVAPGTMNDWEFKAKVAAQARFDASRVDSQRKIDIGGGKLMDRDAVEEIAARRVQPILDEINEKAEKERERKALQKLEEEKQREEVERNKMREREIQEIHKKLKGKLLDANRFAGQQKDLDKARKAEIKREEREKKEEEKIAKAEQKRLARDGKQKEKEVLPVANPAEPSDENTSPNMAETETDGRSRALSIPFAKRHRKQKSKDSTSSSSEGETTSPGNRVKTWFKIHLSRPRAQSSPNASGGQKKFVGGAALGKIRGENGSRPSIGDRDASMREVAMAGRGNVGNKNGEGSMSSITVTVPVIVGTSEQSTPAAWEEGVELRSVSSMRSSVSSHDRFVEARSTFEAPVSPPPMTARLAVTGSPVSSTGRVSPFRESRFSEILE
ncbi:hypothetical protein B0H67DRAFT_483493 [Lasiosphaeris hirsuta]|uniref:Eisosome protein 1 n=1 Tax=Lasiosphaeris hirsuta TaxID=260670 RepID=A0AA40DYX0_9PEZI|nr:hypothetical protein B0H67DRAFT_483493 [Lasiosphaeris hirsuta]